MKRGQINLKKKNNKHIFITVIILVLAIALSISTVRLLGKYKRAQDLYQSSMRKHSELEQLRDELKESVEALNDEQGIDRELRQKLRVVDEGEELIIIVPSDENS